MWKILLKFTKWSSQLNHTIIWFPHSQAQYEFNWGNWAWRDTGRNNGLPCMHKTILPRSKATIPLSLLIWSKSSKILSKQTWQIKIFLILREDKIWNYDILFQIPILFPTWRRSQSKECEQESIASVQQQQINKIPSALPGARSCAPVNTLCICSVLSGFLLPCPIGLYLLPSVAFSKSGRINDHIKERRKSIESQLNDPSLVQFCFAEIQEEAWAVTALH